MKRQHKNIGLHAFPLDQQPAATDSSHLSHKYCGWAASINIARGSDGGVSADYNNTRTYDIQYLTLLWFRQIYAHGWCLGVKLPPGISRVR